MKTSNSHNSVTLGSGNVFADLGLANAETLMAKAKLAMLIRRTLKARKLSQRHAAEVLGINCKEFAAIGNGRLGQYSVEKLAYFLEVLSGEFSL